MNKCCVGDEMNISKKRILVSDAIVINDEIWFMADRFNCLLKANIETGKVEVVGHFPDEPLGQRFLYSNMERIGNKIYFAPYFAKRIAIYDVEKGEFATILLDVDILNSKQGTTSYSCMQKYHECLYFFPAFGKVILRLNTVNGEVEYLTQWSKEIEMTDEQICFGRQKFMHDSKVYVPFVGINAILEFNCETMKSKILRPNIEESGYTGIAGQEEKIWLFGVHTGDIYEWKRKSNTVQKMNVYCEEIKDDWDGVVYIIQENNQLELFGVQANQRTINKELNNVSVKKDGYTFVRDDDDYVVSCTRDTCKFTVKKKESNEIRFVEAVTDESVVDIKYLQKENGIITEVQEVRLQEFLQELVSI